MKKLSLLAITIAFFLILSCEKEDTKDCSDYDLDFLYSVGFPADSSYASVEFSNSSSNIPNNAAIEWSINGDNSLYRVGNSTRFTQNGHFSIIMVYNSDGFSCSVSKEFDITGIK